MNKKILIFLSLIVFVVIIVIITGYYSYKNPVENEQNQVNNQEETNQEETNEDVVCEGDECLEKVNNVINVVFDRVESGLLYFYQNDNEQSLAISEDITFTEVKFNAETFENIGEREISSSDINKGDSVSIIVTSENVVVGIIVVIEE